MNKFKKFLSVVMGCSMAFCALLTSACFNEEKPEDPKLELNIQKTEPAVVAPKTVNEDVQTIINGLNEQNILSVKTALDANLDMTQSAYSSDAVGTKIGEATESNMQMALLGEVVANLSGEADSYLELTTSVKDGGLTVSQTAYLYEYTRGYSTFSYVGEEKPEDISAQTLTYLGSIADIVNLIAQGDGEDLGGILGGESLVSAYAVALEEESQPTQNDALTSILTQLLSMENIEVNPALLIELAAMTGSLSASGDTVTIDVNAMAYALAMQFSVSFATIESTTTISQILSKNVVEKYFKALTDDVSVQQIYTSVCALAPDADLSLFAPQQGATAYEYLISVLSSQDVATAIGMQKPLGNITLGEVVTLSSGNEDPASLITAFKTAAMGMIPQIFTPTAIIIPADLTGGLLSLNAQNLVCEIKLDTDYNAISQSESGNMEVTVKSIEDLGSSTYACTEIGMEVTLDADSEYYTTAQTLTNISNFAVINSLTGEQTTAGQIILSAPSAEETAASIAQLIALLGSSLGEVPQMGEFVYETSFGWASYNNFVATLTLEDEENYSLQTLVHDSQDSERLTANVQISGKYVREGNTVTLDLENTTGDIWALNGANELTYEIANYSTAVTWLTVMGLTSNMLEISSTSFQIVGDEFVTVG